MKKIFFILFCGILFQSCHLNEAVNPLDNINSLPVMQAYVSDDSYTFLLSNKMNDVSVPAKIIYADKYYLSTIKAQGAGSRLFAKWNYFVTLSNNDRIDNLSYFNISGQTYDATFTRTPLTIHLLNLLGFNTFYSTPLFFKINESENGLYQLNEKIDENYFAARALPVYELVKVAFGARFTFTQTNTLSDNFEKKIPDDKNFNNLADFINALDTTKPENFFTDLAKFIDIKEYLRFHAFNTIINNTDGLTNNFYFYKSTASSPYKIIPWDFDKTFDYNANLKLVGDNDIIRALFKNDSCKALYKSEMKNIAENVFNEENAYPVIDGIYAQIKDVYELDPWLKENGLNLENEIAKLKQFIKDRRSYILQNIDNL